MSPRRPFRQLFTMQFAAPAVAERSSQLGSADPFVELVETRASRRGCVRARPPHGLSMRVLRGHAGRKRERAFPTDSDARICFAVRAPTPPTSLDRKPRYLNFHPNRPSPPPHLLLPRLRSKLALTYNTQVFRSGSVPESFALDAGASMAAIGGGARAVSGRGERPCALARPLVSHMAGTVKSS